MQVRVLNRLIQSRLGSLAARKWCAIGLADLELSLNIS